MKLDNIMLESGKMFIKSIIAERPYQQFATFVESLRREDNTSTINAVLEATNTIMEGIGLTMMEAAPAKEDTFKQAAPAGMSLGEDLPQNLNKTSKWDDYKSRYSLYRRLYRELRNDDKFGDILKQAVDTWQNGRDSGIPYKELAYNPATRKATAIIHTYIIGRLADFALSAYSNPEVAEDATLFTYTDMVQKVLPEWNPEEISLHQLISRSGNRLSRKAGSSMTSQADASRFGIRGYEGEGQSWETPVARTIAKNRRARMVMAKGLAGDGLILMPYGQWYKLNGAISSGYEFPDISLITKEDYTNGKVEKALDNPVVYDTPDEIPAKVIKYFLPGSFSGMERFWVPVSSEQVTGRQMGWKEGGGATYGASEEQEEHEKQDYISSIEDPDTNDVEETEYTGATDTIQRIITKMANSDNRVERKFGEVLQIVMKGSDDIREEMRTIRETFDTSNPSKLKKDAMDAFFANATRMGISREDLKDMLRTLANSSTSVWNAEKKSFAAPTTSKLAKKKLEKQYGVDKSTRAPVNKKAAEDRASEFEQGGVKAGKTKRPEGMKPAAFEFDDEDDE